MQVTSLDPHVDITAHLALLTAYVPCGGSSALHLLDPTTKPSRLPAPVSDFLATVNRGGHPRTFVFVLAGERIAELRLGQ